MLDFQLYKPYIQHKNEHINKRYNNKSYVQRGNDFTNCFDKSLRKKLFGGVSSYVLRHSLGTNANE